MNDQKSVLINRRFVDGVTDPGLYSDEKLPGFRLKVTETLTKVYLVYGRVKQMKEASGQSNGGRPAPIKVTIGRHGEPFGSDGSPLTADRARQEAERIRGLMLSGINPNETRRQLQRDAKTNQKEQRQIDSLTLNSVLESYLKLKARKLKPDSLGFYRYTANSTMSDWFETPLPDITEQMVIDRYQHLLESEHIGKANNFRRTLSVIFTHALAAPIYRNEQGKRLVLHNPIPCLSQMDIIEECDPRGNIIALRELKPWFKAVLSTESQDVADYLVLLILTGLRKSELAGLRWKDVLFEEGTLIVRDTKNRTDHTLPITKSIRAVLFRRQSDVPGEFVFPSRLSRTGHMMDIRGSHDRIVKASGVDFDLHDMRRTFSSVAGGLKLPPYVVKALVNHRNKGDVTQHHYLVFEMEMLRKALQEINDRILKAGGVTEANLRARINSEAAETARR